VLGDYKTVQFHYVEAGSREAIVFLHRIPDSWVQFYYQIAVLASQYQGIRFDLKGYSQSEKKGRDYCHKGVADQLYAALEKIRLAKAKFNLVSYNRGSVQADYNAAKYAESVLHYRRGEQHLYHFYPSLAP
jgi:pimeloyl-ACP methyl ester carboxylesterase